MSGSDTHGSVSGGRTLLTARSTQDRYPPHGHRTEGMPSLSEGSEPRDLGWNTHTDYEEGDGYSESRHTGDQVLGPNS